MYLYTRLLVSGLAALASCAGVVGCSHSHGVVRNEPSSVARRLGVPKCRVSVPMTGEEVLRSVRLDGVPDQQAREFYANIAKFIQPGDDIRLVLCAKKSDSGRSVPDYYYAHFRGTKEIDKHYDVILD
jgi:hypothetical protein